MAMAAPPKELMLMEWRIPTGLNYVLYADLVCMVYTAVTCYGRFQAAWYKMTGTKVGLTLQWQGQLFRGFASVLLLPMLLRTVYLDLITSESLGLLLFAEALWIGVYVGTAGPGFVCWLGLLINPHFWLAVGFVAGGRKLVPGWFWAGIVFAAFQCMYTRYTYKRCVFGPSPEDFSFKAYRDAIWQAPYTRKSLGIGTLMTYSLSIRLRGWLCHTEVPKTTTRRLTLELCSAHCLRKREASCQPCGDVPNPFVKVRLGEKVHRTKTRTGAFSPEWGPEEGNAFEATVHPEEEIFGCDKIRVEVWDHNLPQSDRSLGWLELPLAGLLPIIEGTQGCYFRAGLKDGAPGELVFKAKLEELELDRPSSTCLGKQTLATACDFMCRYFLYVAMLCLVVYFVVVAALLKREADSRPSGLDECLASTGSSCYRFMGFRVMGCDGYRNSTCSFASSVHIKGKCLCDTRVSCAYGGVCMPRPSRRYMEPGPLPAMPRKALVLSGGGAKGAWELGVLQGICENASLAGLRNWTMLLGTSIGALNAGFLAQFSPTLQCSDAVPALAEYWGTIVAEEDIWESPTSFHFSHDEHTKCLNALEASALLWYFGPAGGLCDPRPGAQRYEFEVRRERIKASGMELRVLATSLETGGERWWTENDTSVIQGAEASGSIAPLVWPKKVGGKWYIDGGFIANTPLLRALHEGVEDILVIMLSPLKSPSVRHVAKQKKANSFGMSILDFEYDIFVYRYFVGFELGTACLNFPNARIRGYVPRGSVGSLLDFDQVQIQRMRELGRLAAFEEPVDLCAHFRGGFEPSPPPPPSPPPAAEEAAAEGRGGGGGQGAVPVPVGPPATGAPGATAAAGAAPAAAAAAAVVAAAVAAWSLEWRRGREASAVPSLTQPLAHP